jgi:hypothetical protein
MHFYYFPTHIAIFHLFPTHIAFFSAEYEIGIWGHFPNIHLQDSEISQCSFGSSKIPNTFKVANFSQHTFGVKKFYCSNRSLYPGNSPGEGQKAVVVLNDFRLARPWRRISLFGSSSFGFLVFVQHNYGLLTFAWAIPWLSLDIGFNLSNKKIWPPMCVGKNLRPWMCWEFLNYRMSVGKFSNPVNGCWENSLKFPSHTQLKKGLYVLGKDEILLCVLGKSDVC